MLLALRWLHANFALLGRPSVVTLEYDSSYAAASAQSLSRARTNTALVLLLRQANCAASSLCTVDFRKVASHTGASLLNDQADRLAAAGAAGLTAGVWEFLVGTFPADTGMAPAN